MGMIVNNDVLQDVAAEIESNINSAIPQPSVIIGREGSGKTTLLKTLYDRETGKGTETVWIDGRSLFSTDDILSRVSISNRTVLFIDDMDFYFNRVPYDDQYRLRRLLYNEGAPLLVATVSSQLSAFTEYQAPFFEGLKFFHIKKLGVSDLHSLLSVRVSIQRAEKLFSLLPPTIQSVETIRHIMIWNDNPDNDTNCLLSVYSGRYRDLYQSLPTYSQHILNALSTKQEGMVMVELREATGLPTGTLSVYLRNLNGSRILSADASVKKLTRYMIKDPLFKKWLNSENA